jgi:glycosyltransferase involved in cell wall biosynthesis
MPAAGPEPGPPRASVVIPSHGRAERLAQIVRPLTADPATREVIVVADRDEQAERAVAAIGHPLVRAVAADAGNENGARQVGVEAASAELVVLIDDDVLPFPGLVSRHLDHDHDRHVVLGYMPVEPGRLAGVRNFPARIYERAYQAQVGDWERCPERILSKFWAGNFSARRRDLLALGLENPDYRGMYFADYDFGLRLDRAGFTASFDRTAKALHLYDRDVEGFIRDSRRQGAIWGVDGPPAPPPSRRERIASKAFLAGTLTAGVLRSGRAERHMARRLRLCEQRFGAHAAQSGTAEESGLLTRAAPEAQA